MKFYLELIENHANRARKVFAFGRIIESSCGFSKLNASQFEDHNLGRG